VLMPRSIRSQLTTALLSPCANVYRAVKGVLGSSAPVSGFFRALAAERTEGASVLSLLMWLSNAKVGR
jgi:hypothetical protein